MLTKYESATSPQVFSCRGPTGASTSESRTRTAGIVGKSGGSRFVDPKCGTIGTHTGRQEALFYKKVTEGKRKRRKPQTDDGRDRL